MPIITPTDVETATPGLDTTLVKALVAGANAKAVRVNPTLADTTDASILAEARLILIGAVKRWCESGSGAFSQQTIGPSSVSVDTRQRTTGFNLWPSEIANLQQLGQGDDSNDRAFSVALFARPQRPSAHPFTLA